MTDMDSHKMTEKIIAMESRLEVLAGRVHRMNLRWLLYNVGTSALTAFGVTTFF